MTTIATEFSQLAEKISRGGVQILPVGSRTKPALSVSEAEVEIVDMRGFAGVTTYDPSEYLITAKAGTPVRELVDVLAEHGQYLPFDPPWTNAGSTLGGTVAAGISGPSRLLYGGIRDFVMEVELIDGLGQFVRGGGKVVKNAAGFDLPKLLVGSYGRLGILTEVTLKVFPRPTSFSTLRLQGLNLEDCVSSAQLFQSQPLPITAIDYCANGEMEVRFGGPTESLPSVLARAKSLIDGDCEVLGETEDAEFWDRRLTGFDAKPGEWLVHIAISPNAIVEFNKQLVALELTAPAIYSCGGTSARLFVQPSMIPVLDRLLAQLHLPAVVLSKGNAATASDSLPFLGDQTWRQAAKRIQRAIDPNERFASF